MVSNPKLEFDMKEESYIFVGKINITSIIYIKVNETKSRGKHGCIHNL